MNSNRFKVLRVSGMPVSDDDLLADIRAVAKNLGKKTIPQKEYRQVGQYDDSTASRRFGGWNKALLAAGLTLSNEFYDDERLFENLLTLWQHYGRQPRRSELAIAPSTISQGPYNRRFGSWLGALNAFVEYANQSDSEPKLVQNSESILKKTPRDPSLRLRWHVLQRDHFKCCACGASPAIDAGVELHVDHRLAWSNGGETTIDNLQTLCSLCNLGKANT